MHSEVLLQQSSQSILATHDQVSYTPFRFLKDHEQRRMYQTVEGKKSFGREVLGLWDGFLACKVSLECGPSALRTLQQDFKFIGFLLFSNLYIVSTALGSNSLFISVVATA